MRAIVITIAAICYIVLPSDLVKAIFKSHHIEKLTFQFMRTNSTVEIIAVLPNTEPSYSAIKAGFPQ